MLRINPTKILVQDITESQEKTKSGIIIPSTVKVPTMKASVVQVGDGTDDIKIKYEIGDTVLFHPSAGNRFMWNDKEYRLLDVSDVFLGGI